MNLHANHADIILRHFHPFPQKQGSSVRNAELRIFRNRSAQCISAAICPARAPAQGDRAAAGPAVPAAADAVINPAGDDNDEF